MRGVLALFATVAVVASISGCSRRDAPREAVKTAGTGSERPKAPAAPAKARDKKPVAAPAAPPTGYRVMTAYGIAPTVRGNALVLTDKEQTLGVLIFVGGTEALSLALRLQHRRYDRPLTHDLLDNVLTEMGGKVESARVDKLDDDVFHGTVVVRKGGLKTELDARPSDALALALGASAPIYVSEQVIQKAGIDLKNVDVRPPESLTPEHLQAETPGVEL